MTKSTHQRSRTFTSGLAAAAAGIFLAVLGVSTSAEAAGRVVNDHQITVCHATSSSDNPYSVTYPAKWQITAPNGHAWDEGDVIPPFEAGSLGNKTWAAFEGLNWDEAGQALWDDGCTVTTDDEVVLPPAPAATVTLDKVVAGDGLPAAGTEFTFTVDCGGAGEVPAAEVTLTADDEPLLVAGGLSEDDTCTITETGAAGAATTSFSVDGGEAQAGSSIEVTLTADDDVAALVATNTYACTEGQLPDGQGGCATDVCPEVTGLQTDAADCDAELIPALVIENLPPQGPEVLPAGGRPPVQVAGIQVLPTTQAATLPRTGSNTTMLFELGLGLVLLGAGAMVFAREPGELTVR
jgi:hypothetical protein